MRKTQLRTLVILTRDEILSKESIYKQQFTIIRTFEQLKHGTVTSNTHLNRKKVIYPALDHFRLQ